MTHWAEHQSLEVRAAAAIRALASEPGVHFEAGRAWNGPTPLPDTAPHLQPQDGMQGLAAYRGLADALALRLLYSHALPQSPLTHGDDPVAALIFEWLEQWRVESLVPDRWPGMRRNVHVRFARWSAQFMGSGLGETMSGRLLLGFSQVAWSRLSGTPVPEMMQERIASSWRVLAPDVGPLLTRLRALRRDQAAFAPVANLVAVRMAARFSNLRLLQTTAGAARRHTNFRLSLPAAAAGQTAQGGGAGTRVNPVARSARYAVWSRRQDEVIEAVALVRPALLREYRRQLTEALATRSWSLVALVSALRRAVERPQAAGWQFHQEEGVVDGRRLAQLISSPSDHAVFYRERIAPVVQAQIALLVDCSGSMKRHALQVALLMDVLGRAFERAEIPFELLGFTTRTWNGGRPAREWLQGGRKPDPPGRLNELRHLVFRSFDMPRQRGRLGLTAVLKSDLFREGIDGEAVQWACARLLAHPGGGRKVLWVLSDGGPMDSATVLANPPGFLDAHLKQVVQRATQENQVEILGIAVGQDLSAYYPHALPLDLDRGLDMHALLALVHSLMRR